MDTVTGILYLLLVISLLVLAHEYGHYIVARLFGMRVEDFSLFFGPVIARLGKRGDTVFHLRAIPFGGFVRIAGMEPEDVASGVPVLRRLAQLGPHPDPHEFDTLLRQLAKDSLTKIDPKEVGDGVRQAVARAVGANGQLTTEGVLELKQLRESGSLTESETRLLELIHNADARSSDPGLFISKPLYQRALVILAGPFASLLFGYLVFCIVGMTVGLPSPDSRVTNQVAEVMPGGEAQRVGIRVGDWITEIDGKPVRSGKQLVDTIHKRIGVPTRLTVKRGNRTFQVQVVPKPRTFTDETGKKVRWGVIGIAANVELKRVGVVESIKTGTIITYSFITHLLDVLTDGKKVRESVGGPVAMGKMAVEAQRLGPGAMMLLGAQFSLSLFVLNLLPIPVLDGGQLLLLGVEFVRRRKLSPREVYGAYALGIGLLGLLILAVTYNDIARLLRG